MEEHPLSGVAIKDHLHGALRAEQATQQAIHEVGNSGNSAREFHLRN